MQKNMTGTKQMTLSAADFGVFIALLICSTLLSNSEITFIYACWEFIFGQAWTVYMLLIIRGFKTLHTWNKCHYKQVVCHHMGVYSKNFL